MNQPAGRIDSYVQCYGFRLSTQLCMREEGVCILTTIMEKGQESEIHKDVRMLLSGIVIEACAV